MTAERPSENDDARSVRGDRPEPSRTARLRTARSGATTIQWLLTVAGLVMFVAGLVTVVGLPIGGPGGTAGDVTPTPTDVPPDVTTQQPPEPTATSTPTGPEQTTAASTPDEPERTTVERTPEPPRQTTTVAPTTTAAPAPTTTSEPTTTTTAPWRTTTEQPTTTTAPTTTASPSVDATFVAFYPDRGVYETRDQARSQVTVRNTGNTRHTFFVGYSAIGPNGKEYHNGGTTGTKLTLDPGETETVILSWRVEGDAPAGTYDALTVVYQESSRSNLRTELDRALIEDVFRVEKNGDD